MLLGRNMFAAATARLNALGRHRHSLAAPCRPATAARAAEEPKPGVWSKRLRSSSRPHRTAENPRPSSRCYASDGGCGQSSPERPKKDGDESQQHSVFQRFKTVAKKYWYIVVPVHLVTSAVWLGSFYFVASSGVDVPALLSGLGFPEWVVDKVRNGDSWKSNLVITYGLYKVFTPLRYMVTLGGTGLTIRYLRRLGYTIGRPKKP